MIYPIQTVPVGECRAIWKIALGTRKVAGPRFARINVRYEGILWKASRLSYHLNIHPIPKTPASLKSGLVCHTCDNDWCIEPSHLYLGTQKQNVRDMFDRHPGIHEIWANARIGTRRGPETIEKYRGKSASPETKAKMALARAKWWDRKKAQTCACND